MALWKPLTAFVFPPTSSFPCGSAPFAPQPALCAQPILSSAERLTINEPVLREIALKLEAAGLGKTHLVQDKSLGPGLHNQHYRFETSEAGAVFVKTNHRFGFIQIFQSEMESLKVLAATDTLRVPRPYITGLLKDGCSFLAMEYMEPVPFGPSIKAYHSLIPAADGFEERQEVYRLYHYIHHMNNFGAGWGTAGSVKDPKGYYERCLQLIKSISAR
ncbi:hypothetical protein NSK_007448 [Nannochloropsis salina CCMP1776]|uniref:protein-ribulosamine 3-kinase n=1 Tax=Nannochloropsis salina CCMP1776 TaxID=1027361 RepID=A0A4D9CPY6_9STRA|nr:hypothetical protein NSK_007448 [Nannochloropsis salina CCMP1776]|eukprot:TFJ81231.1 hypothetical protein NSK_007448 [Nannochloropsis salina CCMP1776]